MTKPSLNEILEEISKLGTGKYKDGSSANKGWTYHKIPFNEFNDIPKHKGVNEHEFDAILNDGNFKDKNVIEIGCANGMYSFPLSRLCSKVDAYEKDSQSFKINNMIKAYKYPDYEKVNFFNKGISRSDLKNKRYDICLMMNVHMWIEKQIGPRRTLRFMRELSNHVDVIYFQTAHKGSSGRFRIKRLKSEEDIFKYLRSCGFSNIEIINKPSTRSRRKRILFKAKGGNILKNAKKSFIVNNRDDTITKFYKKYLSLGVMENETKWLNQLSDWDRSPKIIDKDDSSITMKFCGDPINRNNTPKDLESQLHQILRELKERECCHNDMRIENILVLDGKIKLIDYEWATNANQEIPDKWPESLKANVINGVNLNDERSVEKLILRLKK